MVKILLALYRAFIFDLIFLMVAGNEDNYKSLDEFEFWHNSTTDYGFAALERLRKKHTTTYNLVSTLAPSFLIGSFSFLQVRRTTIKSWTSLKFGPFRTRTAELAVLEHLKKIP